MTAPVPPARWLCIREILAACHRAPEPTPEPLHTCEKCRDLDAQLLALERGLADVVAKPPTPTPGNRAEIPAMPHDTQQRATLRASLDESGQSEAAFAAALGVPLDLLREWLAGHRLIPPTVTKQAREASARLRGEGPV